MTNAEKRAILTEWLAWALANHIQDDFVLGGSVAFVVAKLRLLK